MGQHVLEKKMMRIDGEKNHVQFQPATKRQDGSQKHYRKCTLEDIHSSNAIAKILLFELLKLSSRESSAMKLELETTHGFTHSWESDMFGVKFLGKV